MKEEKKALRREFLAKRRAITAKEKESADGAIRSLLFSLPEYKNADTLLLYASLDDETDTYEIARSALRDGKKLAYPRCNSDKTMDFLFCTPSELVPGFKNIPEPPDGAQIFSAGEDALCIVPGLLFDREGFRLGYGGGFYDRFLKAFNGTTVGLVRDGFFADRVPRELFDLPCDIIITEKEVIRCG